MWSLDQGGGAAGQNPATSPAVLAGEGAGKVLGVVNGGLVAQVWVGKPPGRGNAAAWRFRPLQQGGASEGTACAT
jgi:hypothetical protein